MDIRVESGSLAAIGPALERRPGEEVIDCGGGAVLPGLHDHHCHVLAMAAVRTSVLCGPPQIVGRKELAEALRRASPVDGWIRGVGYHERVAGDLDRLDLDLLRAEVPVRVQHRSGALWMVNSVGVVLLGLDHVDVAGVERDGAGHATGRLWRLDGWLRERLGPMPEPDLGAVSDALAAHGITGVTDATADLGRSAVQLLTSGAIRQRLVLLGDPASDAPRKLVVADHDLPGFDELADLVVGARPRAVAVHCVTRAALLLTLAVLSDVGVVTGDRIEHAAVAPPEAVELMRKLGVTVVTQPSLPALRGDDYLAGVEAVDQEHLWPFRSLLAAGVPVGCSSDAPYGDDDPWFAVRAAVSRRTPAGRPIAAQESVPAAAALRGYLTAPLGPGGVVRRVEVGCAADLAVLDAPLRDVLADPARERVLVTLIEGAMVYRDVRAR